MSRRGRSIGSVVALASLLVSLSAPAASAAELLPRLDGRHMGIELTGVTFPETLGRDLRSGLENRIVIQVTAQSQGRVLVRKNVSYVVKFDLWEETFKLRKEMDTKVETFEVKDTAAVIAQLSAPRLVELFPLDALPPT